jgi:hypothetical protein
MEAYLGASMLVDALRRMRDVTPAKLAEALDSLPPRDFGGFVGAFYGKSRRRRRRSTSRCFQGREVSQMKLGQAGHRQLEDERLDAPGPCLRRPGCTRLAGLRSGAVCAAPAAARGTGGVRRHAAALGRAGLLVGGRGAFTGDVSARMIREFGARYVIVGHSERRAHHAETDGQIVAKCSAHSRPG